MRAVDAIAGLATLALIALQALLIALAGRHQHGSIRAWWSDPLGGRYAGLTATREKTSPVRSAVDEQDAVPSTERMASEVSYRCAKGNPYGIYCWKPRGHSGRHEFR